MDVHPHISSLYLKSDSTLRRGNMSNHTSAVAPWLGYTAQEYRLVQRLLTAKKSNVLGFEILDDLQEQSQDRTLLEQDKVSTTSRNIVSNQSKDLWKTLSNWVDLIRSEQIEVSDTDFLLYTNKEHTSGILQLLCNANNVEDAKSVYPDIVALVADSSDSIRSYVENFSNLDDRKYELISNFQYCHGSGSAPQDLKSSYQEINTSISEYSENILQEILGWTKDTLTILAENRQPTLVSASAFGRRLGEIESKYRQHTLLNFICNRASSDEDVQSEITERPTYVKQLNIVDIEYTDIEEAVIAKLEAKDAVAKWTVEGYIQESSYSKYSDSLKRKWNVQKNITYMQGEGSSDEKKGMLLYYQCLQNSASIKLENKDVGDFFSHGLLQELSDSQNIGWHPNYKAVLKDGDDDA